MNVVLYAALTIIIVVTALLVFSNTGKHSWNKPLDPVQRSAYYAEACHAALMGLGYNSGDVRTSPEKLEDVRAGMAAYFTSRRIDMDVTVDIVRFEVGMAYANRPRSIIDQMAEGLVGGGFRAPTSATMPGLGDLSKLRLNTDTNATDTTQDSPLPNAE